MARAILRIEDYKPKIALDDTLWKKLEQVFSLPGHIDEAHVDDILETNFKTSPLYSDLKAFTRMTIVPTMTAAGYKSNVIPEMASLVCDVRTLSHQSGDYVKAEIESILGDLVRREVRIISSVPASRSLVDPHFMKAISDSLSRISPGKSRILEILSTGYTDSSVMRGIGAIAYGFEPYHPDSDPHLINYHGIDESIAVDDLVFRTRAYVSICHDMLVQ
jgi:acetylornithine deacetylase/succinyl-diaminopimelate desuccinylase-like protein